MLPALDFVPGALVDGVVDGDYGAHVGRGGVVGFAAHGVEEHLLRGIDPVSGGFVGARVALVVGGGLRGGVWEGARDGADFAVGAKSDLGEGACTCWWRGECGLVERRGVAGLLDGRL